MSAAERREQILEAAEVEFAHTGFHGTSTEQIARRAGISQPYLFRFFATKKELFIATLEHCLDEMLGFFRDAAGKLDGGEATEAIGKAYIETFLTDRQKLLIQMQAFAATDDPDVLATTQRCFGELYELVERIPGVTNADVVNFFAFGMLLNAIATMDVPALEADWARRLTSECLAGSAEQ